MSLSGRYLHVFIIFSQQETKSLLRVPCFTRSEILSIHSDLSSGANSDWENSPPLACPVGPGIKQISFAKIQGQASPRLGSPEHLQSVCSTAPAPHPSPAGSCFLVWPDIPGPLKPPSPGGWCSPLLLVQGFRTQAELQQCLLPLQP